MIRVSGLTIANVCNSLDMILPGGMSALLLTSRDHDTDIITRILLGFQSPDSGEVVVNGVTPTSLRDTQLISYRRRIGLVARDGGLVSNLNIWENLTLQLAYHSTLRRADLAESGLAVLKRVGYDGSLSVLPSRLTLFQRRQICLARAMLAEPELMIYQSSVDGLTSDESASILHVAREFHQQGIDRTALFLTSYPEPLKGFGFDFTYTTGGSRPS